MTRTVARKFSVGGLCVCAGVLDITKLTKISLIYSVSRFSLRGYDLTFQFGGNDRKLQGMGIDSGAKDPLGF